MVGLVWFLGLSNDLDQSVQCYVRQLLWSVRLRKVHVLDLTVKHS